MYSAYNVVTAPANWCSNCATATVAASGRTDWPTPGCCASSSGRNDPAAVSSAGRAAVVAKRPSPSDSDELKPLTTMNLYANMCPCDGSRPVAAERLLGRRTAFRLSPGPSRPDKVWHQMLFFSYWEGEQLKTAINSTHLAQWTRSKAVADAKVRRDPPAYKNDAGEQLWQRDVGNTISALAVAGYLTGNKSYFEAPNAGRSPHAPIPRGAWTIRRRRGYRTSLRSSAAGAGDALRLRAELT